MDRIQNGLLFAGLSQVAKRCGVRDALLGLGIIMGRDEDDGDRQPVLKIEAAHFTHVDVEEEAGRSPLGQPVEKLAGGCEALRRIAGRLDDADKRTTDRVVVVNDCDYGQINHGQTIHAASSS
jgi:hypothetical protein